ncbi:unnamed protein product [Paramecium pentaurelia]|uniref:Enoyl-CoA hydratase n=1 Tax=Paramecium pentaurelia TaxID=43138 RepID=A0A8S1RU28_9CILI|nr:unnamed protein product [Paramecium pentaurelia]
MQKLIYKFSSGLFSVKNHEKIKGLAIAELNNPLKKNALSKQLLVEMRQSISELAASKNINCVILRSSTSGTFCAGADLKERIGLSNFETELVVKNLRDTFNQIANLPQPVIGVIDGFALGGGLELALACDLRIITKSSILGLPETGLAIIPGAGGTQRTPRVIGVALAKELIFTGRRLSADESLKIGLVNYVEEDGQQANNRAENIATQILQNGPIGVRAAKAAINRGMEVDIESGLKIEEQLYYQVCHSQDRLEGLKAFGEKRKPQYKGE